jgi:hypothetical protein
MLVFHARSNLERTKMRPDPKKMSTDGFALNLALVGVAAVLSNLTISSVICNACPEDIHRRLRAQPGAGGLINC